MSNNKIVNHNYAKRSEPVGGFKTMEAFYPFYLGEHCNKTNRRLHIIGKNKSHCIISKNYFFTLNFRYNFITNTFYFGFKKP